MPAVLTDIPEPFDQTPNRVRWTVQQCDELRDAGFLTGRYELIDGDILTKMGQKPAHARRISLFMVWLVSVFGADFVRVQSTISITLATDTYDEPEPDVVVTANPESYYEDHHPSPAEIRLVVEVSDTTVRFDKTTKAALYARADIQEYWVADISRRRINIHRQPSPQGYLDVAMYSSDEYVSPLALPDASVLVGSLLPELT